jgi:hypothetical protein
MRYLINILLALLVGQLSQMALAETSYPMMCKGGTGMSALVEHYTGSGVLGVMVTIDFKKGDDAASPGKGECVWVDRGMRESEPDKLFYYEYGYQPLTIKPGTVRIENGPISYLLRAVKNNRNYYVHAYRSGNRFMITRLGP